MYHLNFHTTLHKKILASILVIWFKFKGFRFFLFEKRANKTQFAKKYKTGVFVYETK